ncbi:alpha/beta fold hydrolase [Pinirhizobacter soli]|uniref:alpha/beta fold hydrolase n=1 Tax=Pinirhizobacter soli TaxID=2786953 RepID=UPI00202ABF20|nr:alpha/beta hydrolase [Pinirhizobacter soli]
MPGLLRPLPFVFIAIMAALPALALADPPFTQQTARDIIAASHKVVSPHGVQELKTIDVNGTKQWISVRGNDTRNPILLFIHGGPASPDMPLSYTFQQPWEDFFTVVQWDQRGAGKTYRANDPKAIEAGMTVEQMTSDATAVVQYLRKTYGKRKIFVIGHSWGSILGLNLAHQHPELLYAYIGVGQMIDMPKNEAEVYRFAMEQAKSHQNQKAIDALKALGTYPNPSRPVTLQEIGVVRQWSSAYGGLTFGRDGFNYDADAWQLAPEYDDEDISAIGKGSKFSLDHLLPLLMNYRFANGMTFECPVFLFEGRHDETVPENIAADWFKTVKAPAKELVWFEDSAHMVMQEQSGRFLDHLVHDARPYAVEAGDAAPADIVEH